MKPTPRALLACAALALALSAASSGCGLVGVGGVGYILYLELGDDGPRPVVASVNPASSEEDGGIQVIILGSDFEDPSVAIGSAGISGLEVVSGSELRFTAPAMAVGTYDVKVENESGRSTGLAGGFAYVDTIAPDAVGDLAAAKTASAGEVDLSWTASGDNGGSGTAFEYEIRHSTQPITGVNFGSALLSTLSAPVVPAPSGGAETARVTGLGRGTYYFALKVRDEQGNESAASNSPSCDIGPPGTITDLRVYRASTTTRFLLEFTAPADDGFSAGSGAAASYDVRYSILPMLTDAEFVAARSLTFTHSPLAPNSDESFEAEIPSTGPVGPDASLGIKFYFAVRTSDDASNVSGVSNNAAECMYTKNSMLPGGEWPPGRDMAAAAYDSKQRRLVVYGGRNSGGVLNTMYTLSLQGNGFGRWKEMNWLGQPLSGRAAASMIYDPVADRFVVFGGSVGGTATDDLWFVTIAGNMANWTLASVSDAPPARWGHTAVYDPFRHRMIVFGGTDGGAGTQKADCFELTLASGSEGWNAIGTAMGPTGRFGNAAVFDTAHDRMIVFGGHDGGAVSTTLYALNFSSSPSGVWQNLGASVAGTPPGARMYMACAFDPVNERMLIGGGCDSSMPVLYFNDFFALDVRGNFAGRWHNLRICDDFPALVGLAAAFDTENFRMLVFGGSAGNTDFRQSTFSLYQYPLNVPCGYDAVESSPKPDAVSHAAMVAMTRPGKILLFGGVGSNSVDSDATWLYGVNESESTAWSEGGLGTGTRPSARQGHSLVYSPIQNRAYLFGGSASGTPSEEVHIYNPDMDSWNPQPTSGASKPSARFGHSAAYDSFQDAMVLLGGDSGTLVLGDVWVLPFGAASPQWRSILVSLPLGSQRKYHSAVFDPVRRRTIIFGGEGSGGVLKNDLAELTTAGSLGTWKTLKPDGTLPPALAGHTAWYDCANRRMIVLGGRTATGLNASVYALYLDGDDGIWTTLPAAGESVAARAHAQGAWNGTKQEFVVFGGEGTTPQKSSDHLTIVPPEPEPDMSASKLTVAGIAPPALAGHSAAYNRTTDEIIFFGGNDGSKCVNTVHVLSNISNPGSETWTTLTTSGTGPPAVEGALADYDAVNNRLVVFGGFDGSACNNDIHALDLGTLSWSLVSPTGGSSPAERAYCAGAMNIVMGQLNVFGGETAAGAPLGDLWRFDMSTNLWTEIAISNPVSPPDAPPARSRAAFCTFWVGMGIYMYGGKGASGNLSDAWLLSFLTDECMDLGANGALAPPAVESAALFLRPHHRGFYFCGGLASQAQDGCCEWRTEYSQLDGAYYNRAQTPRMPSVYGHAGVYDERNQRFIFHGGWDSGGGVSQYVWQIQFHADADGR